VFPPDPDHAGLYQCVLFHDRQRGLNCAGGAKAASPAARGGQQKLRYAPRSDGQGLVIKLTAFEQAVSGCVFNKAILQAKTDNLAAKAAGG